ncbi:hypothetical protein [Craurococcus roseus]
MDGTATTTAGTAFPFLPLSAGRRGLALRCLRRFGPHTLLLFCGGVEVGRLALAEAVEPGRTVEVPVSRLPRVALPAELRLCAGVAGPDLAPPWEIASADAAFGLLGAPAPVVESLRLDHGVLRGVATEKANGLLEPVLYARVNDAAARAVAAEAPAPLAEGGCVFRFAVPLLPADLVEAGLAVDIHMVGLQAPIARFALAPAGGVDTARVAELEGRLRRLEDAMASGLDAMEHAMRRRMDAHGERVDAFIEACASLLLDRVAAEDAPAALRALAGSGGDGPEAAEAAPLRLGDRVELPPDSGHLGFGWHSPERDAGGSFRWMADRALVVSPEPHRPLAGVTLEVGHLYGAAEPALRASFDALPCAVSVEREGDGHRFRVRIAPPEGTAAAPCRTLVLEALASGSPARDGASPDARLLSVAVYRLVFDYAE